MTGGDDFQKRFDRITRKNFKPSRWSGLGSILAAAILIALLLAIIGWLFLAAMNPLPSLVEIDHAKAPIQTGVYQKKYWLGHAVAESITYRSGARNGKTLQFYPNGATLRELKYKDGKLDGAAVEYEQKAVATLSRRRGNPVTGAGPVRWTRRYRAGIRVD